MIIWPHNTITFSQELSATHFLVKKLNLSSENRNQHKKTLARQVIPLAPGYRTALLSRPEFSSLAFFKDTWIIANCQRAGFVWVLENLESPGIYSGISRTEKSSGNLLNSILKI